MPIFCARCRWSFLAPLDDVRAGAAPCRRCANNGDLSSGLSYSWPDRQHFQEISDAAFGAKLTATRAASMLEEVQLTGGDARVLRATLRGLVKDLPSVALVRAAATSNEDGFLQLVTETLVLVLVPLAR